METRRENVLEKYSVRYCKGKYQYKHSYPKINDKRIEKVMYAGPVEPMLPIWLEITNILRSSSRICTESRRDLKLLEKRAKDFVYFKENGITHLIIIKYV